MKKQINAKKQNRKLPHVDNSLLVDFQIASFCNAKRLISEAQKFLQQLLYPTSVFFSITTVEEMGKYYLCRPLMIKNIKGELTSEELLSLQRHPLKQLNSFLPPFSPEEGTISPNISRFWELVADNKLMNIRNNCLYADLRLAPMKILSPVSEIGELQAVYFLETAYEIILLQLQSSLKSLDCDIVHHVNLNEEILYFKNCLTALTGR